MPQLVDKYMAGCTMLDKYVTNRLPFSSINEGFDLMHKGMCLRVVLTFESPTTC